MPTAPKASCAAVALLRSPGQRMPIDPSSARFFAGLLITYLIMLGDVLVGNAPDYNGAITNLAGIHTGDAWFLDRRFVVCCAAACHAEHPAPRLCCVGSCTVPCCLHPSSHHKAPCMHACARAQHATCCAPPRPAGQHACRRGWRPEACVLCALPQVAVVVVVFLLPITLRRRALPSSSNLPAFTSALHCSILTMPWSSMLHTECGSRSTPCISMPQGTCPYMYAHGAAPCRA